jgi:5-methylcytosine-specific restriction protein A
MSFVRGNAAIRDHLEAGRDLLLFQALGKSKGVRFLGVFLCAGYNLERGLDAESAEREAIVFHLLPVEDAPHTEPDDDSPKHDDIFVLRKKAYEASKTGLEISTTKSVVSVKKRSKDVRDYVLFRAKGICECCKKAAPFKRKTGEPYLEPHHTHRLADGGPDNPAWVGAVCPNCHREIHFGERGEILNTNLMEFLEKIEGV